MTGTWDVADARQESPLQVSLWRRRGADLWTFQRHKELWRGGRSRLKTATPGQGAGGRRLITTWHESLKADKILQEQQWSRRRLPDVLLSQRTSVPRQEEEEKKEERTNDSLVNSASVAKPSAERPRCSYKRADLVFGNKDLFDFCVACRLVCRRNTWSCLLLWGLFKCCSFNAQAEVQCKSNTPLCLPMVWSNWGLCSLRRDFVCWKGPENVFDPWWHAGQMSCEHQLQG